MALMSLRINYEYGIAHVKWSGEVALADLQVGFKSLVGHPHFARVNKVLADVRQAGAALDRHDVARTVEIIESRSKEMRHHLRWAILVSRDNDSAIGRIFQSLHGLGEMNIAFEVFRDDLDAYDWLDGQDRI